MHKLIRITTVPVSLEKLLEGQLNFMQQHFDVTAISSDKERLEAFGRKNGLKTFHVEMTRAITPFKDLMALFKLYKYFKKERPLIVHTHTPKAGFIGMLAARIAGIPIRLHTVAGLPLMESNGIKRFVLLGVEKIVYYCATFIYPNSKGLCRFILKQNLVPARKVRVLGNGSSNGIDTNYFSSDLTSREKRESEKAIMGIPPNDLVFIFVGRIVTDKGINELVEAFANLQEKYKDITLLLVGPFEQDLDPIKEANYNLISDHAKILSMGYKEDVRPYFAVSDVLVFPSYREGFPNVVMQAGAMGLPSIVTDINGSNEIIIDGYNGTIIPVKNQFALEKAMSKMIEDNEWRNNLANNSSGRISDNFERFQFWKILLNEYRHWITMLRPN